MTTRTVELPDGAFSALRLSPAEFSAELRLAAAVNWYESGKISQEVAAEIAGLCRTDFLLAIARLGRSSFHLDMIALDRELARG